MTSHFLAATLNRLYHLFPRYNFLKGFYLQKGRYKLKTDKITKPNFFPENQSTKRQK
jgi:hypothetical protein